MKIGDDIDVRPAGSERWVRCKIDMVSKFGRPAMVSAEEGLPLVALDPRTNRQVLCLIARGEGEYECLHTGRRYEAREVVAT